jgi:hypothetical protein
VVAPYDYFSRNVILYERIIHFQVNDKDAYIHIWFTRRAIKLTAVNSPPSIIKMIKSRRMRWAGHVARMGAKKNAYRILVGKPEGKRPLGRPRRRWVDSIKMDLREI